MMASE